MHNHIVHLFKDADLRCQHDGLKVMASKSRVNLSKLVDGEHVVFINAAKNKVKMFSANEVLSYYRAPSGRLNLNMIEMIPRCFSASGAMDWNKADRMAIDKLLNKTI